MKPRTRENLQLAVLGACALGVAAMFVHDSRRGWPETVDRHFCADMEAAKRPICPPGWMNSTEDSFRVRR